MKNQNIDTFKTKDFMLSMESFSLVFESERSLYKTLPVPENLEKYYESDSYISHTDSTESLFDKVYQIAKHFNLKRKIKWAMSGASAFKLLDVGCGTGDFLNEAKQLGITVDGVEINKGARNIAEGKLGRTLYRSISDLKGNQYDRITLWHVLEHLESFEKSISELIDLLKPGGVLIIAVPNFKSFDANYYKSFWAAYDTPRHLWHFSRETFIYLAEKFQMDYLKDKPMLLDSFYVSLLSEKYKNKKFKTVKGVVIGFWSNIAAIFTKQHSSQVYFLRKPL